MAEKTQTFFESSSFKTDTTPTSSGSTITSYTSDLGPSTPILTLIHGYPQSAYEYRYLAPALKSHISLFIPELPGYGISTPTKTHSKRAVGTALLEALVSVFGKGRTVILGGHDRGARICHRLAVDRLSFTDMNIVGVMMLDIVPTWVQWQAGANPLVASGYFHWPMLANPQIATNLLMAYGGDRWARDANTRLAGPDEAAKAKVAADGAIDVYAELFKKKETIYYSSEDYAAGAREDVDEQKKDQADGRKIDIPTLVMFSKAKLGSTQDVALVWQDWIREGTPYTPVGVGGNRGHYLPEEASNDVLTALETFLKQVIG
jgi:pimeloyl-ACP methyl ester carboxylesterase